VGKLIFWIVVIFVVLFALRLYNTSKLRQRDRPKDRGKPPAIEEEMVRCVRCGTFVPRSEARPTPAGLTCGETRCLRR